MVNFFGHFHSLFNTYNSFYEAFWEINRISSNIKVRGVLLGNKRQDAALQFSAKRTRKFEGRLSERAPASADQRGGRTGQSICRLLVCKSPFSRRVPACVVLRVLSRQACRCGGIVVRACGRKHCVSPKDGDLLREQLEDEVQCGEKGKF